MKERGQIMYKITLHDGTVLDNLFLNGNNFISVTPIDSEIFKNNLKTVLISDDDVETVHYDMKLVQNIEYNGEYWFILAEKTPEDKSAELINQMKADTDYLAIMTGAVL